MFACLQKKELAGLTRRARESKESRDRENRKKAESERLEGEREITREQHYGETRERESEEHRGAKGVIDKWEKIL